MNIKDLIEVIMCEDVEEKGIVKVYIDSLTDEELNLLLENVGEEIKIDDDIYTTYRVPDFNYIIVEKLN